LNSAREMKEPRSWRTICISTGELSIHARMSDPDGSGARVRPVKGGLTHRALDIEIADIVASAPEQERGDIVSGIKSSCARQYGTAGPELIRSMVERFATAEELRAYVKEQTALILKEICPGTVPTETLRAMRRFALIAVAGAFAAERGLIPTTAEKVRKAVGEVASAWLGASAETDEQRIVAGVRAFILRHAARFQRTVRDAEEERMEPVRDRAGFLDKANNRWCFTREALVEAAPGNDAVTIARALREAKLLFTNDKKLMANIGTEVAGRVRLYAVLGSILEGGDKVDTEQSSPPPKSEWTRWTGGQAQQPQGAEAVHLENAEVDKVDITIAKERVLGDGCPPCPPDVFRGGQAGGRVATGSVHLSTCPPVHFEYGVGGKNFRPRSADDARKTTRLPARARRHHERTEKGCRTELGAAQTQP